MAQNPFADGLSVQLDTDTSGLESGISGAIGRLGDLKKAAAGAGVVLGGLAAGGLAKSASAAADFEDAMVGVEKVTDPETAAEMEDKIQDLAETMPVAQEELAGIAEQAGRLGVEGTDNIADYTETVAQMATATDLTGEEASDAFARIGTLMDIPVEQSSNLGSAMNELSNNMGTSASEITDVMTRAGGSFNQLGVGKEQALALSGAMNEVSPTSRLAASGLKRMSESMMDPSNVGAFAEALGVTEEEFETMREEDPSGTLLAVADAADESDDAANTLKDSLGKTGQDFVTLGQNTESARDATETATEAWAENTSMQEEAETAASTFNSQMEIAKNRLRNVGITIGQQLLPPLTELLGHVLDGIEWFSDLNDRTDGMLGTFILLGGLLAGVASAAVLLAPAIAAVAASFGILLGPIGLVVLAIAGLAAAWQANLFGIQEITRGVIERLQTLFAGFKETLGSLVEWVNLLLSGDFSEAWTQAKQAVVGIVTGLGTRLKEIVTGFVSGIVEYVKSLGKEDLKAAFKAIGSGIRTVALAYLKVNGKIWELFTGFVSAIGSYLKEDAKDDLKAAAGMAWDGITTAISAGIDAITPSDGLVVQMIGDVAEYLKTDAVDDLTAAAAAAWGGIMAAAEGLYEGLIGKSLFPDMISDIGSYLKNDAASDLKAAATETAQAVWNGLKDKFNNLTPSSISIPTQTIGGGSVSLPSRTIAGKTIGGGSLSIPSESIGGQSIGLPSLQSGGFIEAGGLAQLHAGERVVPAAQVTDRGEQTITVEQPDAGGQERLLRRIADAVEGAPGQTGQQIVLDGRVLGEVVEDVQDDRASLEVTR